LTDTGIKLQKIRPKLLFVPEQVNENSSTKKKKEKKSEYCHKKEL